MKHTLLLECSFSTVAWLCRKFQVAMQLLAIAETVIYINMDDSVDTYWVRLLAREWAQFCIFVYIGWTFRSQDLAPRFSVVPAVKSKKGMTIPPTYSVEMDAAAFRDFCCHEWHIGVPTAMTRGESPKDCILVIVQQPCSRTNNMANKSTS
ncbi:hypothetical protein Droror1_Dr00014858 [Drosera rotundifolia]